MSSSNRNVCYDLASTLLKLYLMQLPITILTVLVTIAMNIGKIRLSIEPVKSLIKAIIGSLAWGPVLEASLIGLSTAVFFIISIIIFMVYLIIHFSKYRFSKPRLYAWFERVSRLSLGCIIYFIALYVLFHAYLQPMLNTIKPSYLRFQQINNFMGYFWLTWLIVQLVGIALSLFAMFFSTMQRSWSQYISWAFVVAAFLNQIIYLFDIGCFFALIYKVVTLSAA